MLNVEHSGRIRLKVYKDKRLECWVFS